MQFVLQVLQVLAVELAGVGVLTGILYVYWNLLCKHN